MRGHAKEAFLCVLAVLAFYHPLWNFAAMQSGGDAANLFWPLKIVIAESLWRDGTVPLWNPWSFMGAPLAGSLQHAVFYPLDWLVFGLLPAHAGMNATNLLHLALCGAGTWFWLRQALGLPAGASVALGAAFPCTAWFWGQQEHINQIAAIAWMPWMAAAMAMFVRGAIGGWAFAAAYSAMSAMQFLTGHPQEAFYSHLFAFALWAAAVAWTPERGRMLRRTIPGFAAAALLAGMMSAVQLLPTLEVQKHSRRQFPDPAWSLTFSMPPDIAITYLRPHHFGSFRDGYFVEGAVDEAGNPAWDRRAYGEYAVFVGQPTLLLAAVALALARRRRLAWGLAAGAAAAFVLALGGNTQPSLLASGNFTEFPQPGEISLHAIFVRVFAPAAGFRVPARIITLNGFCLVTLAALGVAAINEAERFRRLVSPGAFILIFASLYLPSLREKFREPISTAPARELLAASKIADKSLDGRIYRLAVTDDQLLVNERHRETTLMEGNPIFRRMLTLQPHMNAPAQWPNVDGYEEGLVPTARFKDFLHFFSKHFRDFSPDRDFLSLLGVSAVLTELPINPALYPRDEDRSMPGRDVFSNPEFRGAAFWRRQAEGVEFAAIDGPFWRGGEPLGGYMLERVRMPRPTNWGQELPRIRTALPSLNRVEIVADGAAGDAVLAMGWFPGWQFPSGAPVEWLSAVHASLPVGESAGGTRWRLAYRPFAYALGLFLTAMGVGAWCAIAAARRRA